MLRFVVLGYIPLGEKRISKELKTSDKIGIFDTINMR